MIKIIFIPLCLLSLSTTVAAQYGTIYSKNFWDTTSDFITNGNTTATLSGNYINISSATTLNYSNTVYITGYTTKLSKWRFRARFRIQAWASNSYGIGFGVKSVNTNVNNDVFGFIQTSNTGIGGLYVLRSDMTVLASGPALGVALNDVIDIETVLKDSVVTFNTYNITSGISRSVTYTYVWDGSPRVIPNTGRFALLELGGTHQLQNIEISSDETVGATIAVIGDSKTAGYFASSFAGRYAAQLNNIYPVTVINAGGGDKVTEALARKDELERLTAQKYLLCIGSNDLRFGGTLSNLQYNYDSLVRILQATGADVYHIVMPEDYNKAWAVNMLPFKNWVETTYGSFYIGGVWDSLKNGNILKNTYDWSDGIHLNQTGNNKVYEALIASGKLSGSVTTLPIKLISFDARKITAERAILQWEVDDTDHVQNFSLMKSYDGSVFSEFAQISPNINSYLDNRLADGNNYYRLKIIELDGKVTYSKTALISNRRKSVNITDFQFMQPSGWILTAEALHSTKLNWKIIDVTGKIIKQNNITLIKGVNTLKIPVYQLNHGLWFLILLVPGELPEVVSFFR